jgi:hypothetical protein
MFQLACFHPLGVIWLLSPHFLWTDSYTWFLAESTSQVMWYSSCASHQMQTICLSVILRCSVAIVWMWCGPQPPLPAYLASGPSHQPITSLTLTLIPTPNLNTQPLITQPLTIIMLELLSSWDGNVAQVVKCLPSKYKAPSSNSTAKEKNLKLPDSCPYPNSDNSLTI